MEQFLNFGSQGLQERLAPEEESFDEIVGELTGVKPESINPLFTWKREHSAMHDHVEKFCDDATRKGVDAMIRQCRDGFLQNHISSRVFPGANKYVNGVAVSDNFEAIRASSTTISTLLRMTDGGEYLNNNEAIRKELAIFNRESQRAEEYVIPSNEVLSEGCERAMLEKFASVIQEMKTSGETKSLFVIERDYLNHLSEEFREAHLTSCVGKQLDMKKTIGTTIYVLVIVSYHVVDGTRIHNQSSRINNIVGLIKDLALMHALEVIDEENHDRERGIFTRCAIECEGLEGTIKSPVGSIYFASLFATGENYVLRKVKVGVKYLGDILSGGVGMHDIHTISLYALLGNGTFADMMKRVFNLNMDGLYGDFLVRFAHESQKKKNCESYQSNVDDQKELEQRVFKGDKLDTVDQATLSKLTAKTESSKKRSRDTYQIIVVTKRWYADEDSKLVQLVEKSNSTRTKWTELSCQMENRTPQQCRVRYNNSIKPNGKKGQWTKDEDKNIIRLHAEFGNKWSKIASSG